MTNLDKLERAWRAGEHSKMTACELAVTEEPGDVARRISVSPRTVQRMRTAGNMYLRVVGQFEDQAEELRNGLYYSHWAAVGEAEEHDLIDTSAAFQYLQTALLNKWSVDKLRSKVPHVEPPIDFLVYSHKKADELEYNIVKGNRLNVPEPYGSQVVGAAKVFIEVVRQKQC